MLILQGHIWMREQYSPEALLLIQGPLTQVSTQRVGVGTKVGTSNHKESVSLQILVSMTS